ncbi:unnamed protein product [Pylaiella littoralis]
MSANFVPNDDTRDDVEVDLGPKAGNADFTGTTSAIHPSRTSVSHRPGAAPTRGERCGRCFRRKCVRVAFRLVNLMFAVLFGASAVLQYNDEAGLAWAALYFVAAVFCVLSELSWRQLRTFVVLPALWVFTMGSLFGAAYVLIPLLVVGDWEGGASGEDAMDFYGIFLVSFWMCIVLFLDRHNVVGVFRGYTSLTEHERDGEGHVQMGEVVI